MIVWGLHYFLRIGILNGFIIAHEMAISTNLMSTKMGKDVSDSSCGFAVCMFCDIFYIIHIYIYTQYIYILYIIYIYIYFNMGAGDCYVSSICKCSDADDGDAMGTPVRR